MSAIINNYRQLDVAFLLLNDLTTKLRTAGARISVRKVGNFHRITVLKEPTIASIEQILGDTSRETETPNLSSNNAITSPSEITSLPDETFSEAGSNTLPTVSEDIEDNSVVDAIAQTSPESITPPSDTPSEDVTNTVPTINVEIEDNSVVEAIAQKTLPEAIALPELPESTSSTDDTPSEASSNTVTVVSDDIDHSSDSNDIIPCDTAELITDSTDSPTPDHSSSEVTNIPDSPELASLENLQSLTLKRLKELAKLHKIPGFSRMKEEKLVSKLHGLATKEQVL
ncbi:hypothetical protein [Nodularia spumigena]|uniref:Rho termination factor N-terminal domain-containing protein n=1 Tax=Nodularia spumigena UHCC 0060 TaxID=3110300 RepID=A0ABU5UUG4_NODSP|nr:hypothetical protein [Nodularia spumigena]MEA5609896.1 hypothetical protein [Nodularia spumigena UHCC 0060]MEA5616005.1 hypothetical protein [Nodularia spumigena UHCC 0040]